MAATMSYKALNDNLLAGSVGSFASDNPKQFSSLIKPWAESR
jgi:hypothetical protein